MGRKEGSFGMIGLLVIMGIVLLLVAKNWKAVAPQVLSTSGQVGAAGTGGDATIHSSLPEARQKTDAHSGAVQEAFSAAE